MCSTSHAHRSDFTEFGRYDKHDCVRLIDQPAEPIFPFLSGGNVVAINERGEANELEPPDQFVNELAAVPPRVRNDTLRFSPEPAAAMPSIRRSSAVP